MIRKVTKERAIEVQATFQEMWNQHSIEKRQELFARFVSVTEFLEAVVVDAPSARVERKSQN